jgi:hypothetical protein
MMQLTLEMTWQIPQSKLEDLHNRRKCAAIY